MRIGLAYDLKETVSSGGDSLPEDAFEEYDYPATVDFIIAALKSAGHHVARLGGGKQFLQNILREKVDIVFNIAEGRGTFRSREAQVPGVLEMLGIPFTGSDPAALAISLDKILTKQLVALAGVATPPWRLIRHESELNVLDWADIKFPAIVKPAYEGSSKGVRLNSVIRGKIQGIETIKQVLGQYRQPVLLEGFITGDEVTVGILGNSPPKIVGMMRILPRQATEYFVYSLEVKRDWQVQVDYECPAKLSESTLGKIADASLRAFAALECRDFARVDFRLGADGTPYFIEINPLPGLGDYSDLVIMAVKMGWQHDGLIRAVLAAALERYPQCVHA